MNFAYWWESHEVFEGLWHSAGDETEQGNFFRALIHLAAANLKWVLNRPRATHNLLRSGLIRLRRVPSNYMGVDVDGLVATLQTGRVESRPPAPLIALDMGKSPAAIP
jgi:hypothetical protein